jgi:IS30 family transposase
VSTISDELKRNRIRRSYDPLKAHHKAYVRRKYAKYQGMRIVENAILRKFIEEKLCDDQSPLNISGRVKRCEKQFRPVSKNSIYRFIKSPYGRKAEYCRRKRKNRWRRKRRFCSKKLEGRIFIDKRPRIIDERKRIGDAEADFIVSGKSGTGIVLVVADRKSRAPFLERIIDVTIRNVHAAFKKIKKRFPELQTITTDNDLLFQHHKKLEKLLGVKVYFCHPYHSWEKGTVENINRYIRKDIPKGSDISKYSKRFIRSIETKLQRRIFKRLKYLTPMEVLGRMRKRKKRPRLRKK